MLPPTGFSFKNRQQNKSSSASAFVEGSLNDLRANKSTSNIDLYLSSNSCQLSRHVREADVLLQKGGGTA
jgi:deoxyribodipyrimidine photolyase